MSSQPHGRPEAFYLPAGDGRYLPTLATQSPWEAECQHGGPPTALLAAAIADHTRNDGLRIGRVTADFLGPIPLAEVEVRVRTLRPGRRVQLAEAEMLHDGVAVVIARAWQFAVRPDGGPATAQPAAPVLPEPEAAAELQAVMDAFGYGRAHEWRVTSQESPMRGPSSVWARPRVPLMKGRPTSGVERILTVADSANGLSLELPLDSWLSIPPGLSVTVLREPVEEWVHMAARTHLAGDGVGLTEAEVTDTKGLLAVVAQPLHVAPRG
ncbi:MAG: thioesterase family protein [Nocardiopsaceae bacterium]|nr:thioesterase family protein [Nocardiopsaceae bacterium]